MYLNHEYMHEMVAAFAYEHSWHDTLPAALSNAAVVSILFILSACVSAVTFCMIEYPFLRLRERVLARQKDPAVVSSLDGLSVPNTERIVGEVMGHCESASCSETPGQVGLEA